MRPVFFVVSEMVNGGKGIYSAGLFQKNTVEKIAWISPAF